MSDPDRPGAPTPDHLRAVLAAGIAWLHDTAQPETALMQHHGVLHTAGDRLFRFVPGGRSSIVVVDVAKPEYGGQGNSRRLVNPLGGAIEMRRLAELLVEIGQHHVIDQWNGKPGSETGSLRIATAPHFTLTAAVDRYRAGCPKHNRSVFCGSSRDLGGHDCYWFRTGYARIVHPTWPAPCDLCGFYGHSDGDHPDNAAAIAAEANRTVAAAQRDSGEA